MVQATRTCRNRRRIVPRRRALNHALRTLKLLEEAARETSAAVRGPATVEEIESLFDTLFAQHTLPSLCEKCGSEKFSLKATVSLAESERSLERPAAGLPKL